MSKQSEVIFAAGNFWQAQDFLSGVEGVIKVEAGYAGGTIKNPNFHNMGDHMEAVRVTYNPRVIMFEELLTWFWRLLKTTNTSESTNAVIYWADEDERRAAKQSVKKRQADNVSVEPATAFYPAEDYHQHYFKKLKGENTDAT